MSSKSQQRAAQAVNRPCHDDIECPPAGVLEHGIEARALVAQEALIAGVPLIATKVGGIPELVGDGAVLVRLGDSRAAARALRHLAEMPYLRAELAARGRAEAAAWPDEDHVAADVLAAYRSVLR